MLWLKEKKRRFFSGIEVKKELRKRGIKVLRTLQESPGGIVFRGDYENKKVAIKSYHPQFLYFKCLNEYLAFKLVSDLKIRTPQYFYCEIRPEVCFAITEFIPFDLFRAVASKPFSQIDNFVLNFITQLKRKTSMDFGPLINKNLAPGIGKDYLEYLNRIFEYFLMKTKKKKLLSEEKIKSLKSYYYHHLISSLKKPEKFYLSHADLSLKHLFLSSENQIGVIDWEEAMFLDGDFDLAVWFVRTQHERQLRDFYKKIKIYLNNLNFFKCHLFREGFIQTYYKEPKRLSCFIDVFQSWMGVLGDE